MSRRQRRAAFDAHEPPSMSTTDLASDPSRHHRRRRWHGRRVRRLSSAPSPGWVTTTDTRSSGAVHRCRSARCCWRPPCSACCSASSASTAPTPLLDAGALPQLFSAYRVGLVFGVVVPLLLGLAVAVVPLQLGARSLAFPRLAAAGFWTWLGGLVLVIVALANNGGPGGGDADMVDLFLAALALTVDRSRRRRGLGRHDGAHHPGAGHAHAPGAVVLVVGADRVARSGAGAAGPARRADLPLRRPPLRPGRCSAATPASARGSASPSPSRPRTCSPCPPSASSPS